MTRSRRSSRRGRSGGSRRVGPDGEVNLAPYSYFNAVGDRPPMLMFSSAGPKDSATFAGSGGEFVWNMATYDLREQMNETSATLPRGENEFDHAGLEMAPSRLVAPPRVAAAPVALECRVIEVVPLRRRRRPARTSSSSAQVVGVHVDERYIVDGRGRPDAAASRSPAAATAATTRSST